MDNRLTWIIEDHLHRFCGGRILRAATHDGLPWTGTPLYRCADCGEFIEAETCQSLCWCGHAFENRWLERSQCAPKSLLEKYPHLERAFKIDEGEIGVLMDRENRKDRKENVL